MEDRRKAKDAYDIYFILQNYPHGLDEVAKAFEPYLEMPLVQEGLRSLLANSHPQITSAQEMSPISLIRKTTNAFFGNGMCMKK